MAHRAVLAGDVLVLEHDARPRPVIWSRIRTTDEIDDLVCLDRAGAWIHRVRSNPREIIDREGLDGAITVHGDTPLADVIAGVNVRIEALDPIGDELDGPAQQLRETVGCHLIGVDVDLDAERSADVLADDADLRLGKAEMLCRDVLHHMRRLRALIDRQSRLGRIPIGHHGTRLQRHTGMTSEEEVRFHDFV